MGDAWGSFGSHWGSVGVVETHWESLTVSGGHWGSLGVSGTQWYDKCRRDGKILKLWGLIIIQNE